MALLLGIDLGTSYIKAGLFDRAGRLHGLGRVAVGMKEPAPGRKELPLPELMVRPATGGAGGAGGSAGIRSRRGGDLLRFAGEHVSCCSMPPTRH
jgi:hypothetical protein